MLETYIRPLYQHCFVDPIANVIAKHTQWSPNNITIFSVIIGIGAGIAIAASDPVLACLLLLLSGFADTLDGTLARLKHISTEQGALLDIVGDRVVEFAIILGLCSVSVADRAWLSLWMLGANLFCITSFLVVGIFSQNNTDKSFHYHVGIMERSEAFIFYIAMILLPGWFHPLAWTYVLLVLLTAIVRICQFL